RLDDVIHFPLKAPTLTHPFWGMEEKSAEFVQILWAPARLATYCCHAGDPAPVQWGRGAHDPHAAFRFLKRTPGVSQCDNFGSVGPFHGNSFSFLTCRPCATRTDHWRLSRRFRTSRGLSL